METLQNKPSFQGSDFQPWWHFKFTWMLFQKYTCLGGGSQEVDLIRNILKTPIDFVVQPNFRTLLKELPNELLLIL